MTLAGCSTDSVTSPSASAASSPSAAPAGRHEARRALARARAAPPRPTRRRRAVRVRRPWSRSFQTRWSPAHRVGQSGAQATKGHRTSRPTVSEPCRPISRVSPVSAGSRKATGAWATSATSPSRRATSAGQRPAEPPVVDHLLAGPDPRLVAVGLGRRRPRRRRAPRAARAATGTGPRPRTARPCRTAPGPGRRVGVAHLDLAVVGGDRRAPPRRAARRARSPTSRSTAVSSWRVVVAEAVLVGDLVEAVVVRVDEGLPRAEQPPDLRRPAPTGPTSRPAAPR